MKERKSIHSRGISSKLGGFLFIFGGLFATSVPLFFLDPNFEFEYISCKFSLLPPLQAAIGYIFYFAILLLLHIAAIKIANHFQLFRKRVSTRNPGLLFLALFCWMYPLVRIPNSGPLCP